MTEHITISAETPWYDLFSRGSRDWLRHNQKVRDAVKQNLPDLVAGPGVAQLQVDGEAAPCRVLPDQLALAFDAVGLLVGGPPQVGDGQQVAHGLGLV